MLPDPIVIEALVGARRDQIEGIRTFADHRELGMYTAARIQRVAQADAAQLLGQAVGQQAVEEGLGAGA